MVNDSGLRWIVILPLLGVLYHAFVAPRLGRRSSSLLGPAVIGVAFACAAAAFVRLLGMNGFLVFHVLLLFVVCACGYIFSSARSRAGPALAFTLAFLGASVVPVYAVFLMPEIFNFSIIFVAYFFWLYKEVARPDAPPWPGVARWLPPRPVESAPPRPRAGARTPRRAS